MMRSRSLLLAILFFSFIKAEEVSVAVQDSIPNAIVAGEDLSLAFSEANLSSRLLLKNAYGQTIISADPDQLHLFLVPEFISEKSGVLEWRLLQEGTSRSGEIMITSEEKPVTIENYFGPRSIQAGYDDFSMLVSIPTDVLDNPLNDGTKVEIAEYFQGVFKKDSIPMQHMFAWKNIYTKPKAGNITVTASSIGLQSKEMISQVYPSTAQDFTLSSSREHEFADGNQVLDIVTSQILDAYGNVVSDGTSVEFIIEDTEGVKLKSSATTISGVATAKVLHPEQPEDWRLSANVTGIAISDTISLSFSSVLKDFRIKQNQEENIIEVGPLESFMGQLVADGATVRLQILNKNSEIVEELQEPSEEGFAVFTLPADNNYWKSYTFRIEAMGLTKSVHAGKDQ